MFQHLRIDRPLVFVDTETTGVDPRRDRIIEISMIRFRPGFEMDFFDQRFNPGIPIPPAAIAVHGIRDEDVANCPVFRAVAPHMADFIGTSDLAGFGIARFDVPFLVAEFDRVDWRMFLRGRKVVDALTLFHHCEPRDLKAAVRMFVGRELESAHRASQDVSASVAVLDAMLGRYPNVPRTIDGLHQLLVDVDLEGWFKRVGNDIVFTRGKHKGTTLDEVALFEPSYLSWMMDKVLPDARAIVEDALRHIR